MGYTFNRQKPLNRYIVDFYCKPLNLVIEVDGAYHNWESQKIKDAERQEILESMNVNFLRFSEFLICNYINQAVTEIRNFITRFEESNPGKRKPVRRNKNSNLH